MAHHHSSSVRRCTTWRWGALLLFALVWLVLAGLLLPSLDGPRNNTIRLIYAAAFLLVGAVRWMIGWIRRENNDAWVVYGVIIIAGPIASAGLSAKFR